MGVLSDRLAGMRVRVTSSDGMLDAELANRTELSLRFAPGSYRDYNEQTLEDELAGLLKRLWDARMTEHRAVLSEAFDEGFKREPQPRSQRDAAFDEALGDMIVEGSSADGRVQIVVRGMRDWTVRIAPRTLRYLPQQELTALVSEAVGQLIRDQSDKLRQLRVRFYD